MQAAEELSAFQLVEMYAEHVGMSAAARDRALALLKQLSEDGRLRPGGGGGGTQTQLQLDRWEMEGFGPYRSPQVYDLSSRVGLRAVTGQNVDDDGAESNGAGKSSLVMAPFWALTGETLARSESGTGSMTLREIINDGAKAARVRLEGSVNGVPFVVERRVERGTQLRLSLGGHDETGADVRMTQRKIDELFNTPLLRSAVFFGQNDVQALLESRDTAFKEMLKRVVDMDVWDTARAELVAPAAKEADASIARKRGELSVVEAQASQGAAKEAASREAFQSWEAEQGRAREALEAKLQAAGATLAAKLREVAGLQRGFDTWLADSSTKVAALEEEEHACEAAAAALAAEVAELQAQLAQRPDPTKDAEWEQRIQGLLRQKTEQERLLVNQRAEVLAAERKLADAQRELQGYRAWFDGVTRAVAGGGSSVPHSATAHAAHSRKTLGGAAPPPPLKSAFATVAPGVAIRSGRVPQARSVSSSAPARDAAGGDDDSSGAATSAAAINAAASEAAPVVCQQCKQPVTADQFQQTVARLELDVDEARLAHQQLAEAARQLQQSAKQAAERHQAEEQRRQKAAQEYVAAVQSVSRKSEQQTRQAEKKADVARRRTELQGLAAYVQQAALPLLQDCLAKGEQEGLLPPAYSSTPVGAASPVAPAASPAGGRAAPWVAAPPMSNDDVKRYKSASGKLGDALRVNAAAIDEAARQRQGLRVQLDELLKRANPHELQQSDLRSTVSAAQQRADGVRAEIAVLEADRACLKEVDEAFGRKGVPSFALEAVLKQLEAYTAQHLEALSDGMVLQLNATSRRAADKRKSASTAAAAEKKAAAAAAAAAADGVEQIEKVVFVRESTGGGQRERSVYQLSGGERRRVAVALSLGFAGLVRDRGRLACNLLVLDEVAQQLDGEGCSRLVAVLQGLPIDNVLLVGQARSFITELIDDVDVVVKRGGEAFVESSLHSPQPLAAAALLLRQ